MKIIEQQIVGKHTMNDCEDGIVVTPHFIAVVDGSTSKTPHRFHPDMKNGRYCMLAISDFIRNVSPHITLAQFCEQVTAFIHALYPSQDASTVLPPHERLCASAIVYSCHRQEIWMIGDCQCMVDGLAYSNDKPYEEVLARRRAEVFPNMLKAHPGMTEGGHIVHDYARDTIIPSLIESMAGENTSYAVIDGYPIFMPGVRTIRLSPSCNEVVLASDGYPHLRPTLQESEEALRHQLSTDPFCIHSFVATKGLMVGNGSFDDRAYVRFDAQ